VLDLSNVRLGSNERQRRCERPRGREAWSVGRIDLKDAGDLEDALHMRPPRSL
jgi:hypothetical protein